MLLVQRYWLFTKGLLIKSGSGCFVKKIAEMFKAPGIQSAEEAAEEKKDEEQA
jgi:hypothetical protein